MTDPQTVAETRARTKERLVAQLKELKQKFERIEEEAYSRNFNLDVETRKISGVGREDRTILTFVLSEEERI